MSSMNMYIYNAYIYTFILLDCYIEMYSKWRVGVMVGGMGDVRVWYIICDTCVRVCMNIICVY